MQSSGGNGDGFKSTNELLRLAGVCETWQCDISSHGGRLRGVSDGLVTGTGRRSMCWTMAAGATEISELTGRVLILSASSVTGHEGSSRGFAATDLLSGV